MTDNVIECVVNFSVGKNTEIINQIKHEIEKNNAAKVVHIHSHKGADRSVFTVFSNKENIVSAMYGGIIKALELIDMNDYKGNHPAIGAVDIVPFVPLNKANVSDCKSLANDLAKMITQTIDIPIYLYGLKNKSDDFDYPVKYRKRGFKGLKETLSLYTPDYGKATPHSTGGAMLVGARNIMLAYNITLDTKELAIGKEIAKKIRTTGYIKGKDRIHGSLGACQAIAWFMEDFDRVQISCNLHDIKITNIFDVYKEVENLSRAFNIKVKASEIIGLAPLAAFNNNGEKNIDEFMDYIKLNKDDFDPEKRIIENLI